MKLGPKSKILIFFIIIIVFGAAILVWTLINSPRSENPSKSSGNNNPSSTPNVITINPSGGGSYNLVAVTNQDTIVAYDNVGRKLDLQLERLEWKDLDISEDGKVVSVLGKQNGSENFDLGIYNFSDKNFKWSSNFKNEESGISQYIWKDIQTIFFNQGSGIDEWLHKFMYPTKTEIVKIVRNNNEILSASVDGTFILFKDLQNNLFYITNSDGKIAWIEKDSKLEDGGILDIDNIYFSGQPDKLFLRKNLEELEFSPTSFPINNKYKYYKTLVNEGIVIEIEPIEYMDFTPVCIINEDKFLGYQVDVSLNIFKLIEFDIKEEKFKIMKEYAYSPKFNNFDKFSCIAKNKLLFSVDDTGNTKWLSTEDDRVKEIKFLENAREVKPIPVLK